MMRSSSLSINTGINDIPSSLSTSPASAASTTMTSPPSTPSPIKSTATVTSAATSTIDPTEQRRQDRKVCYLRSLMISTLVSATAVVAYFAGTYVASDERSNFEVQYGDSVAKVAEAFQHRIDINHDTAKTFSSMITSRYDISNNDVRGVVVEGYEEEESVVAFGEGEQDAEVSKDNNPTAHSTTWNYNVTIPDFQEQTAGLLAIADGRALSFNPIITQDVNRLEWEEHAAKSAWILGDESLIVPASGETWPENRTVSFGIYSKTEQGEVIYDEGHEPNSKYPDVMVPVWQIAPIISNEEAVMFNLHSESNRREALDHMMEYKVPAFTALIQLVQDGSKIRPSSILFYPVFDTFCDGKDHLDYVVSTKKIDGGDETQALIDDTTGERKKCEPSKVVGTVSMAFSWDILLKNTMPDYIKGMVCVLKSSTGLVYSYKLSGDTVTLLGSGDLHDTNYDEYGRHIKANLGITERIDIERDFITYSLHVYPSREFEALYVTNKAGIAVACVVVIFLFTSVLFLLYDYLVESRQQQTVRLARQAGSVVDSLFPAAFRDRLFSIHVSNANAIGGARRRRSSIRSQGLGSASEPELEDGEQIRRASTASAGDGSNRVTEPPSPGTRLSLTRQLSSPFRRALSLSAADDIKDTTPKSPGRRISLPKQISSKKLKQIDKFMKGLRASPADNPYYPLSSGINGGECLSDEPVAELFHDTSIMFSDIVGFTKWSSERSPNDVFRLLEQIFWEFDDLAFKLGVFKLGTIGDCYIAVTGIPVPVADHAIVLTQFAFEAREKVRQVCQKLEREGLDTARLDMRFGIHSGATTAGILRGTKSRFELFGDTINTASRMESTGIAGKIQVSEETAELIGRDKPCWLTKRATTITAKGKGELQTYWVEPQRASMRVSFSERINTFFMDGNPLKTLRDSSLRGSQSSISILEEEKVEEDDDSNDSEACNTHNIGDVVLANDHAHVLQEERVEEDASDEEEMVEEDVEAGNAYVNVMAEEIGGNRVDMTSLHAKDDDESEHDDEVIKGVDYV